MSITVNVLRPDDLLCLTIEGHNLRLDSANADVPVLVLEDAAKEAFLVAVFPPQSFAEEALFEADAPQVSDALQEPGAYSARISGPSRLAFRVPAGTRIPFSIQGLLDWSTLEPSLTPLGALEGQPQFLGGRGPPVTPPLETETAIEFPYRLFISPDPAGHWRHPLEATAGNGRAVLWHTRLVVARGEEKGELGDDRTAPIRAVFSPDFASPKPADFRMALTPQDRQGLVRLTSTFNRPLLGPGKDLGRPAQARKLLLTSLGGFLDATGSWPDGPAKFSLVGWSHVAALGRDCYVRVVRRGRLLPLTNRVTQVVITERRFEPSAVDGSPVACLRQYVRLLIDEPEVAYPELTLAHGGRQLPIERVRVNVTATPKLDAPQFISSNGTVTQSFEVKLGGALWPFPCTAFDRAGNPVDFSMGMIFVLEEDLAPPQLQAVAGHYGGLPATVTAAVAKNAKMKLADFTSDGETTTFLASSFRFDVDLGRGPAGFLPKLTEIGVRVPSLELLTGSTQTTPIKFTQAYLDAGLDPVSGLFAEIAGPQPLAVAFSADQAGGIVRPDLSVHGFSSKFGPIAGDLSQVAAGDLDLGSAFGSLDAKLFGALPLKEILGTSALAEATPKITTLVDPLLPGQVTTSMLWETRTTERTIGPVTFTPSPGTRLSVTSAQRRRVGSGAAGATEVTVDGKLDAFSIELLSVVLIRFKSFRFSSGTGKKTSVEVALADADPIQFKGALDFVRKLTELIPPGIFGASGPRLVLRPESIEVGFNLPLPPAALGVFSIRNIVISTSLTLPFLTGRPSFAFAFATREKPFQLAILILGGGGFVRVELDVEGVRSVEVMLEFGGVVALDVGVASGSVHILAGIYIALAGSASELTGYVRVGGEVCVLAIVSVSIEFMLSLSYLPGPVARGVASVTLSVRVAFLSKSVSFSVERSFSAGSDHLSIGDAMNESDWALYAGAFG